MSGKRKNDDSGAAVSGREKKKQRTAAARTIAVQSPGSSTPQVQNANAVAGPSKSTHFQGGKQLPGSLDVERFAEARAFEINAMHTAMQTARESASHRAWQELPRHLRRRAASHDVRRVPLRLRDKARAEMDPMRKKALGRSMPKRGKAKQITRTKSLLKRQQDKVWLETHIWHAKRMKMENMWGYRLAVNPTEKAFRPSHRASVHGSILHDASYYGFIELKGPESVLCSLLDRCCDPQGPSPGAKRFLTGSRACDTYIYEHGAYPFGLISPIAVIWQSQGINSNVAAAQSNSAHVESTSKAKQKAKKGKGKEKEVAAVPPSPSRVVWVRIHPSVFQEVYLSLQTSGSFALEAVKDSNGPDSHQKYEIEIADLRERLNVFEIMGPKSSQVIRGALKPQFEAGHDDFKKFWQSLPNLQSTASLPRNMVIGFTVNDPRLTFPPKNAQAHLDNSNPMSSPAANIFPSSVLAKSEIWDEKVREKLRKPKFKKKDLDQRRSQNVIPGTSLQPKQLDDRIPVLLIQRSLESTSEGTTPGTSPSTGSAPSLHGWTLVIPSGWSMPFFSSLTYTGTRVGGQRERQTQMFEAGKPYFPHDTPCTKSYQAYSDGREDEEKSRWERKPPAKRPNYDALLTRSPWQPDWDIVLGLKEPKPMVMPNTYAADLVTTQREQGPATTIATPHGANHAGNTRPWLLRGPEVHNVLKGALLMFNHATGLHDEINKLRAKRKLHPLDASVRPEDLWRGALVTVKLRMCGRGRPDDLAMIYSVDDDEHAQRTMSMTKDLALSAEEEDRTAAANRTALPQNIIGYVTTGNFSLSLGEGYAIGAIPVARLFELRQQATRLGKELHPLVKIRDRAGTICRAAYAEVLEG